MKTSEEVRKQIENEYSWWQAEHRHLPNVAYVKCLWNDDDEPEDCVQTIVIDEEWYDELSAERGDDYVVPFIKDEEVLYYCSNVDSLIDLTRDNTASDFKVVDFIGFERLREEEYDNKV